MQLQAIQETKHQNIPDEPTWIYGVLSASEIDTTQNPRRQLVEENVALIAASMKASGQIEDVVIRLIETPSGKTFVLAAGGHRVAAAIRNGGPHAPVKAKWRQMTDAEFQVHASVTNTHRTQMTPVEEAEAAAKLLETCNGDHAEAALRLGMTPATFKRRLALTYAIPKVRDALQDRKIELGHAELLAVLRKEAQDAALTQLLAAPKVMTVAELKSYLDTHSCQMNVAIFDKTDCTNCHHNSEQQGALFSVTVSGGRCTNRSCYEAKTEGELSNRANALKDEFQVVRIVRPGENLTLVPLRAGGANAVGAEQATACRTCKDFGAVVSGVPDKLGNVYKDMCMNVECNKIKAKAFAKSQEPPPAKSTSPKGPDTPSTGKPADSAEKANGESKTKPGAEKPVASSEPSNRVKEYREGVWREMFRRAVSALPAAQNRWVLLAICMTRPSVLDHFKLSAFAATLLGDSKQSSPIMVIEALANLEDKQLAQLVSNIAAHVSAGPSGLELKHVTDILGYFEVKVENYWKISPKFCELLTKNELDAVCDEIGLKAAMGADYAKAKNGSKEDFIKAVLAVDGFAYLGAVPKLMQY